MDYMITEACPGAGSGEVKDAVSLEVIRPYLPMACVIGRVSGSAKVHRVRLMFSHPINGGMGIE